MSCLKKIFTRVSFETKLNIFNFESEKFSVSEARTKDFDISNYTRQINVLPSLSPLFSLLLLMIRC